MAFRESKRRARKDHSAENLATMRHIALNRLKRETDLWEKALFASLRNGGCKPKSFGP